MKKVLITSLCACLLSGCFSPSKSAFTSMSIDDGVFLESENTTSCSLTQFWERFENSALLDLIKMGTESNRDLQAAMHRIEAARAHYGIRKSDLFPQVDVGGSASRMKQSDNALSSSPTPHSPPRNYFTAGFDALWELDLFGQKKEAQKSAFALYQSEVEIERDLTLLISSEIGRIFAEYKKWETHFELTTHQICLQKRIYTHQLDLFQAGLSNEKNVQNEINSFLTLGEKLTRIETEMKATFYALALLVGEPPEKFHIPLSKKGALKRGEEKSFGLPSELLRRRADIRSAEAILESRISDIGVAVCDYFPKFSLLGSFSLQSNHLNDFVSSDSKAWSFGSHFRWPILTFGRLRENVQKAHARTREAAALYEQTILKALSETETSLARYFNQNSILTLSHEKQESIKREEELMQDRFEAGLESEIALLKAQIATLDQEIDTVEKESVTTTLLIALYKTLGGDF